MLLTLLSHAARRLPSDMSTPPASLFSSCVALGFVGFWLIDW